ncbi:MAG: DNA polymerase/3'-5' exonuclease PolX [Phycisphaerae bacterium]|jgi:DNA polymerase (family 10)
MTNADVARVFAEVADLMEIKGEDAFRVNSYRRVARTIDDLATDINEIAARGELTELAGVGKGSAEKIQTLLDTGRLPLREELAEKVPDTLLALRDVPSLGPKKIALLWREVGVTSLADLRAAIDAGRMSGLKGFGEKSIQQIRQGLDFLARSAGRIRLGVATRVSQAVADAVRELPGVHQVEVAGSLRRGAETIGDLDLLCLAEDPEKVIGLFTKLPGVTEVLAAGQTKGSVVFEYRPRRSVQIDLRIVPAESFGAAWQYFTGSKQHNVRLRELAVRRGWSLNEYGLTEGDRVIASHTEEEIYKALGLPWLPPELREDRGELALSEVPGDLLTLADIRGDLHLHTVASDGVHTVEEMAAAAKAFGHEYICITDHSHSSTIANGLDVDRLEEQTARIQKLAAKTKGVQVWAGTEVDILADGSLDYPDKLLAKLDFVVASIHSGMGQDIEANTRRTLAAIRNPYVNVIGHPTGRLLNKREAMALDIKAVCREAARTGTALEINASDYRLDLKDQHARLAAEVGALLCINTDAHATDQYGDMQYGVLTGRRAWLRKEHVLNTRTARNVKKFVISKRGK